MLSRLKNLYGTAEAPAPTPEEALAKLREAVTPHATGDTESYASDSCLHRYLAARNGNVKAASKMLQDTLTWRASFRPQGLWSEHAGKLRFESETGKMFVLPGVDRCNRSIIVMRTGLENSRDARGNVVNLVYTLERAATLAKRAGGDQYVVVVDYTVGKISASTLPGLSVVRETTGILQGHYPERLACMVLVRAPKLFHTMFKVVRPLVDSKTREKIHFVNEQKDVVNVEGLDRASLTKDFGGDLDWTFDVDHYFDDEADSKVSKE